jgi:choline kinase
MKAVVIAAGFGSRLRPHTENHPKAMVRLEDRELILRVMDFLDGADFSERIVVTGYRSEVLTAFLKERRPDVVVLNNPDFHLGSVKTLEKALPRLDEDFLLLNTDHVYPRRMLRHIMKNRNGITAVCDYDRRLGDDDMKVKLDGRKRIKSISKTLKTFDGGYIGMTWCDRASLDAYKKATATTLERCGESANVEAILATLASEGVPIETCDTTGIGWLEIDDQNDLNRAAQVLRSNPDFLI